MNNRSSLGVEEIRRIRNEDDKRRQNMNAEELAADIRKSATEGHAIMEKLRNEKAARQGA
ncbi:MAG: hypothetical protein FWE19_00665 [Oscillospiraceae bacterium]|nr:hypothetical protein [Oscillospiraceae bacterium]